MKCGRHDAMLFLLYIFLFPNAQSKKRIFEKKVQMFDLFLVFYYFSPKLIVIIKWKKCLFWNWLCVKKNMFIVRIPIVTN